MGSGQKWDMWIKCEYCDKGFTSKMGYNGHVKVHKEKVKSTQGNGKFEKDLKS